MNNSKQICEILLQNLRGVACDKPWWVALSGGQDSMVLLHGLVQLRDQLTCELRAVHINHGLNEDAASWREHCQAVCEDYQVPLKTAQVDLQGRHNLEARARQVRYNTFKKLLSQGGVLMMAHHQQDQVETLLLRLMRGTGMRGLAGIPKQRDLGQGILLRPLLDCPKSTIQVYARQQQLTWVEDPSNQSQALDRNYMRHTILPLLDARWLQAQDRIANCAAHCSDAYHVLQQMHSNWIDSHPLPISALFNLAQAQQQLLLQDWLWSQAKLSLTQQQWLQIQHDLLTSREDAMPSFSWRTETGRWEIRRYRQALFICPPVDKKIETVIWQGQQHIALAQAGHWQVVIAGGCGLSVDYCRGKQLEIRFRQGGERFKLRGTHHHQLKKLMQAWAIPPWMRDQIPLLYADEELIAVLGFAIAVHAQAQEQQQGYVFTCVDPHGDN